MKKLALLSAYAAVVFAVFFVFSSSAKAENSNKELDPLENAFKGKVSKTQFSVHDYLENVVRIVNLYPVKEFTKKDCGGENCSVTRKSVEVAGEHLLVKNSDGIGVCQLKIAVEYLGNHMSFEDGKKLHYVDEYLYADIYIGDVPFDETRNKINGTADAAKTLPYCQIDKKNIKTTFKKAGSREVKAGEKILIFTGRGDSSETVIPVIAGGETKNIKLSLDPSGNKRADGFIADREGLLTMRSFSRGYGMDNYEYYGDVKVKK